MLGTREVGHVILLVHLSGWQDLSMTRTRVTLSAFDQGPSIWFPGGKRRACCWTGRGSTFVQEPPHLVEMAQMPAGPQGSSFPSPKNAPGTQGHDMQRSRCPFQGSVCLALSVGPAGLPVFVLQRSTTHSFHSVVDLRNRPTQVWRVSGPRSAGHAGALETQAGVPAAVSRQHPFFLGEIASLLRLFH